MASVRKRARKLARNLPLKARVLDIGCGNGNFLRIFHLLIIMNLHGIGTRHRRRSPRHVEARDDDQNIAFNVGDYPNDYFDGELPCFMFSNISTIPREILSVIDSILRPGQIIPFISKYCQSSGPHVQRQAAASSTDQAFVFLCSYRFYRFDERKKLCL